MRYAGEKDLVLNYVFSDVIDGTLKFDRKISQKALGDNLQISRTPIREASIELTREGVFERSLNRGFAMKKVDLEEVQEAYKIIGCLEGYADAMASVTNLPQRRINNEAGEYGLLISGGSMQYSTIIN